VSGVGAADFFAATAGAGCGRAGAGPCGVLPDDGGGTGFSATAGGAAGVGAGCGAACAELDRLLSGGVAPDWHPTSHKPAATMTTKPVLFIVGPPDNLNFLGTAYG